MMFGRICGLLLAVMCLQSAAAKASSDTIWLCRDTTPELMYFRMYTSDTFPDNRDMFDMVDTGDAIEGNYINFDYEFGPPRPGYAGFKIFWDYGAGSFYAGEHDSMVLWHKGPLQGHKVMMIWAQGSAGCGTPINYQYFGEYKSSQEWKRECFPFPEKRNYGSAPDSPFVKNGLFELRMLIYNDSSAGNVSETSPPGNLKIDNMAFIKKNAAVRNVKSAPKAVVNPKYFVPTVSGRVTLTIFSLQGEQLFKEPIDVVAGKRYNISKFARQHSNLPAKWIHCVQINGGGVDITSKVVR